MFFFEYSSSNQSLYSDEYISYIGPNIANRVALFEECHIKERQDYVSVIKNYQARIAFFDEKHEMLRMQLLSDMVYSYITATQYGITKL